MTKVYKNEISYSWQKQSPRGGLYQKMFFEISQKWQENTCAKVSFLKKLQVEPWNLHYKILEIC